MATVATKRNFIRGGAKEVSFSNGGSVIHIDLNFEDLAKLPKTDKGYIKLDISRLKNKDKFGNTHTVFENSWKPDTSGKPAPVPTKPTAKGPAPVSKPSSGYRNHGVDEDDLPF